MTICVGALLLRGEDVLLGRRAAHKTYAGCWDLPGGHVEPGETIEAALGRELGEEIGVIPLRWMLLETLRFIEGAGASDLTVYAVTAWSGEAVIANDEHLELRWFPLREAVGLEGLAVEAYRPLFRRLGAGARIIGGWPAR